MKKILLLALIGLLFAAPVKAEDITALKASYLFHFLKFIQWDDRTDENYIKVCAYNTNGEMEQQLAHLEGKLIKNKKLFIEAVTASTDVSDCHLMYLQGDNALALDKTLNQQGFIVVTDQKTNFTDIYFFERNGRLRFNINQLKVSSKALKVSSRLLRLSS